MSNKFAYVH